MQRVMQRFMAAVIVTIVGISGPDRIGFAWAAQAQQFSAEIVNVSAGGDVVGTPSKIYVAEPKVRIETPDLPGRFLLIDGGVPAAYLVHPPSHVFMDAKQSSRLTRLFVPVAADDPCPQWHTMAVVAGIPNENGQWRCEPSGHETVAGRAVMKFDVTSPQGHGIGWVDPELEFPLKIETEDGAVFMLRNIQEAPQPADLFIIPAGYQKFDPHLLIERLKHSDVFVEPPNQNPN